MPEFPFGGHSVRVVFRDLPGDHNLLLDNYVGIGARMNGGRAEPGSAKAATVVAGLKKLEIDGENIPLTNRKKPLPLILDHEKKAVLFDYVLGMVVQHNPHLLWKPEYADIFTEHLHQVEDTDEDDEEAEEGELAFLENPT